MFQFPGCPSHNLFYSVMDDMLLTYRVSPFGHPRLNACFRLPSAFRRLLRPSSAVGARASTLCSSLLDLASFLFRSDSSSLSRRYYSQTFVDKFASYPYFLISFTRISFVCAVFKVRNPIIHRKWAEVDSNHRPHAYQACALTN